MRHCIRAAMVAILVLCSFGPLPGALAQGNVNGTVYTSPTFDYQLQWSAPWFFIEELSESGYDVLVLADGLSQASFLGTFAPGASLQDFLDSIISEPIPGTSNFQPMLDAQGVPLRGTNGDQEWALYTGTATLDDGSTFDFVDYYNMRSLAGGVALLMSGSSVSFYWDDTSLQTWHDFANSVLVNPTPGPDIATAIPTTAPPTPTSQPGPTVAVEPTETSSPLKPTIVVPATGSVGEPAPAFAAGPWRIAVRAVDLGESIDYLGLGFVNGNQWVVVYADVTNWSDTDQLLETSSMTLVTAGGEIAPDAASTQSAASLLGLEPANGTSVQVPAGASIRVALVYSIPASETELILSVDGNQLPLADAVGRQFDVTDLSTIATPPALLSGTLRVLPDDGSGQPSFLADTGNGEIPIQLVGLDFTEQAGCTPLVGDQVDISIDIGSGLVWLEADPAITTPDTYYVWLDGGEGNLTLLNEGLIANGLAFEGDMPEAARFGAWLEQTERVARATKAGIWQLCA